MRTTQRAAITLLTCAAAAAWSCTTRGERSDLVVSAVLLSSASSAADAGPPPPGALATCSCPLPGNGVETSNVAFTTKGFRPCILIENRLPNNGDNKLRLNTNDMIIEDVKVDYESTSSTPLNVGTQILPASGLVPAAGKLTFGALLVPPTLALPPDVAIRLHVVVEGKLLDGSKVKSSEYEYIAVHCTTGVCPASDSCNY